MVEREEKQNRNRGVGAERDGAVLLYDGTCGLCARSVQFVIRRERRHDLRFARLSGAFARSVLARYPRVFGLDTVVWYEPAEDDRPERLLARSAAVLQVLRYLGGPWRLVAQVAALMPAPVRDGVYRLVARWRRRLFRLDPECLLPSAFERGRFLD